MKTFYFSLLAKGDNPKVEVRRVVSAVATSEANAERDILLENSMFWNRDGWSIGLISISETHAFSLQSTLGVQATGKQEGVRA